MGRLYKSDFKDIAYIMKYTRAGHETVNGMIPFLASTNPSFKAAAFKKACGLCTKCNGHGAIDGSKCYLCGSTRQ